MKLLVLFPLALASAMPLLACQKDSSAENRERQGENIQQRGTEREVRAVRIIFANFYGTNARLLIDGESIFDGPLNVQDRAVGISKTIELPIAIGRRSFHLISGSLDVTVVIDIGRETETVVINPRYTPYIEASNRPARFD